MKDKEEKINIKFIGCGGIGTQTIIPLCQYLNYKHPNKVSVTLIDGDSFEMKNASRQLFTGLGNKAEVTQSMLTAMFSSIKFDVVPTYITDKNIKDIIQENDITMACVDNNNTRYLLEKHILSLKDGIIISGGNDYIDGNVMCFVRKDGKTIGKVFSELHDEIKNGKSKSPSEMSCAELQKKSDPQLVITNFNAGGIMMNNLYSLLEKKKLVNECFFDITLNKVRPVNILEV